MVNITIIGSGNVAQHLITAFENIADAYLLQVFARDKKQLLNIIDSNKITDSFNDLKLSDIYIIAVSDFSIAQVSSQIPFKNQLVVHTSGGISIDDLNNKNRKGVFYPLQTFTKNRFVNFNHVPICLEAQNQVDYKLLEKVAKLISNKIYNIDTNQRKSLHIAAIFVNNFVNYLYQVGSEICTKNKVDFEILKPLILETANKVMEINPRNAQTGPAKRADWSVIESHLDFLINENQKNIYKILTNSIQTHG